MFTNQRNLSAEAIPFTGGLLDRLPANMIGGNNDGVINSELTPEQQAALADAEIARKAAEDAAKAGGTTPPANPPAPEGETPEQIQAKLDVLAAKDEATLTAEEKKYIADYTQEEQTAIDAAKNLFVEKYSLDLGEDKFDESPEGVVALVDKAAPIIANRMLEEHFASIPQMAAFYKHVVQEGKSVETFLLANQKPAFEAIELKEVTSETPEAVQKILVANQKELVRLNLSSRGVPAEDIEQIIDLAEAAGTLFTKAANAKAALKGAHTAQVQAQLDAEEARIVAEEKAVAEQVKQVELILQKNDFGESRAIAPADIAAFKAALFNVDGQGHTLMDYKRAKMTLQERIFVDYLLFKGLKTSGYVKPTQQVQKFTFQKKNQDNNGRDGGRTRGAGATGAAIGSHPNIKDIMGIINK